MLNLILFGPPGSGKGTQSAKLVEKYNLVHISTGDLFRKEKKNNSELWQEVQSYVDKGKLAPDSITFRLLKIEMDKTSNTAGYILDGFPRNVEQAAALDTFLKSEGTAVTLLVELKVPDSEIITRISSRGKIEKRVDDQDSKIIQTRLNTYKNETSPVAEYYTKVGKTKHVDGLGTIEEIFSRICIEIDSLAVQDSK